MRILSLVVRLAVPLLAAACAAPGTEPPAVADAPTLLLPDRPANAPLTPPDWKVGDSWTYSDGYGMRVVELLPGGAAKFQRTDDTKQWFVARGHFRESSQSATTLRQVVFRSEEPSQLYDLPAGKPVVFIREYTRNGVLVRHRTSWVLEGRETITVPAGTFDTFILTMRSRSLTGNWTGFERWWYSPEARNYVRMEYKYGEAPESARVLTAFQVK